jgi:glyoxylase-like metal-dependent hydrolase (beta-lactamase superfamily II)
MKFFCHFGLSSFSNAYILGPDAGGDAVVVDPGVFDETLLNMIENNNLYIRSVLVTHGHDAHTKGIPTLLKIYDATIYSYGRIRLECDTRIVREGEELQLGELPVRVLETPGHTLDSVVYLSDRFLFTGDTLYAGSVGKTPDAYSRSLQLHTIQEKILTLDDEILVFPGHGPPSKIGIERHLNPELTEDIGPAAPSADVI